MLARAPLSETAASPRADRSPGPLIDSLVPALDTAFALDRSGTFPEEIAALVARLLPARAAIWDEEPEAEEEAGAPADLAAAAP
ncbi:hypothetical protein [Methylobacterium sp. WSM2598]|uniref:hypothetical protein n=1 Tax=Methylobacterium sp. WSM2598 TaxID=398261 RepID=UPI0003762E29|nr:hypothetical protein [Methylobacterium sp. WSM2598]